MYCVYAVHIQRIYTVHGVRGVHRQCYVISTRVQSLGGKDPLEKGMTTHSSILPGESHGMRSLAGYSPWDCKESDTTEAT